MDCSPPGSYVHGILQASTGVGCHFLLQGTFLNHGSNLGSLALQADSLLSEPQGSPKGSRCWGLGHLIMSHYSYLAICLMQVFWTWPEPLAVRAAKLWQLSLAPGANPSQLLFSHPLPRMSRNVSAPAAFNKLALWASPEGQCSQLREISLALCPGGIPSISHMAGNTMEAR